MVVPSVVWVVRRKRAQSNRGQKAVPHNFNYGLPACLVQHWVWKGNRQYLVWAACQVVPALAIDYVVEVPSACVPESPIETIAGTFSTASQLRHFGIIR
jgi:hypothetical protein